jgi:energy-coupling factor transporter transmembrane protein EcfT
MTIEFIITILLLALVAFIAFKIFKKILKAAGMVVLFAIVLGIVIFYIVGLDAKQIQENIDSGTVTLYSDKLGFETEPIKIIPKENLNQSYSDLLGNKTRLFVYNLDALKAIDANAEQKISSGNYTKDTTEFGKIVKKNTSFQFILLHYKKGNIAVYPESPVFVFAKNMPDFLIKTIFKE